MRAKQKANTYEKGVTEDTTINTLGLAILGQLLTVLSDELPELCNVKDQQIIRIQSRLEGRIKKVLREYLL